VVRGLYSSANSLLVESLRTDVISANLAGLAVPGHRREVPVVSSFDRTLLHARASLAAGPSGPARILAPQAHVDLSPGELRSTGNALDIALDGPGYLCALGPTGEAYTRAGALRLDPTGTLVTAAGDPVLGQSGPVRIAGGPVVFGENGDVIVDGNRVDRLKLVDFAAGAQVRKLGRGLLEVPPGQTFAAAPRVRQGYLEASNANAVQELAAMIAALRAFEAGQRALQANDQTLDRVINEVGRA